MIEINNLTTNSVDEKTLKKIAKTVLEGENKKETELSIVLVGPGRMRKLNKTYRGKNRTTDVLSFGENLQFQIPASKPPQLGEIVICPREVRKNAKRFKSTFEEELALCLIHGILHLLGYDHENSKEDAKKMEEKQNYYLAKWQNLIS